MESSRNKDLSAEKLIQEAKNDLSSKGLPEEIGLDDAVSLVRSFDGIANNIRERDIQLTTEDIFPSGCVLGYAFLIIFSDYGAQWEYSEKAQRWVIVLHTVNGERIDLNVFNKLEKRFDNGDEDSLEYYMQGIASMLEGITNF